jgi:hypothetical protein
VRERQLRLPVVPVLVPPHSRISMPTSMGTTLPPKPTCRFPLKGEQNRSSNFVFTPTPFVLTVAKIGY